MRYEHFDIFIASMRPLCLHCAACQSSCPVYESLEASCRHDLNVVQQAAQLDVDSAIYVQPMDEQIQARAGSILSVQIWYDARSSAIKIRDEPA